MTNLQKHLTLLTLSSFSWSDYMKSTVSHFNRVSSLQELGRIIPLLVLSASGLLLSSASYASDPFERDGEVRAKGTFVEAGKASGTVLSVGWNGLNIRFPHEIHWTSSKVTVRDAEQRACVAVGSDDRGPVELILVELNGYFAATFTDGSGVRWSARNTVGQPIVFTQVAAKDADFPRETLTPSPELVNRWQKQQAAGQASNEGGIAGNCTDSETVDILVVYTPCALFQSGSLGQLLADLFLGETITNTAFTNSAIDTQSASRQIRIVAVQPTPNYPIDCGSGQAGCQPDPADAICGADGDFGDDLTAVSDINTALGGAVGQMRDYHSADLVIMVRVGAGVLAFQKQVNAGCISNAAFMVIGEGSLGIGSTAMTIGLGRLFGCCEAPGDNGSCWEGAIFPYSSGHRFVGDNQIQYRTIMAQPPGFPITYFSNPNVLYEGQPTGTSEFDQGQIGYWSDNARTIRQTFDDVRCYRCDPTPTQDPPVGTVRAWGAGQTIGASPNYGQSIVPSTLGNCKRVAAGYLHTVAIRVDGIVKAWGAGTTIGSSPNYGQSIVPVVMPEPPYGDGQLLGTCREIAAGLYHTVAIRMRGVDDNLDGTVVCWGAGVFGTLSPNFNQSRVPLNLGTCKKVSAGHYHTLALQRDGVVRAWGAGFDSNVWPNIGQSAVPLNLGPCIDIAAGGYHSVAIKLGGVSEGVFGGPVVAWGAGQTNSGFMSEYGQSIVPVTLGDCTRVAAGVFHTVALKRNGTVRAFGAGITATNIFPLYGQSAPQTIPQMVTAVAAGGAYIGSSGSHTLALTDQQTIRSWGANGSGQTDVPVSANGWVSISAGGLHSVGIENPPGFSGCLGDFNQDGIRDGVDLTALLSGWGTDSGDCTGDGKTDGSDLTLLLSGWGNCN